MAAKFRFPKRHIAICHRHGNVVFHKRRSDPSGREWIADDRLPTGIPSAHLPKLRKSDGRLVTIRVDTKVVEETDSATAKDDEVAWMRTTLDTVGKLDWLRDSQGRSIYPEGFQTLAEKLGRPLHPPGRDIRCIVSVGMLTEGWDCNTVTHIVGLRPFIHRMGLKTGLSGEGGS